VLNDISGYGGKEAYEEINKVIEEIGDDIANERKKQRVIQVVGGVGLGILGAAAVICTVGAASPIVVAAGVAIGAGTACFAWSEVIEGGGSIYYGSIGDCQTLVFNPIRDTILFGYQDGAPTPINFSLINPCDEISREVAESFSGATFTKKVLTEDTVMYRVSGGNAGEIGSYMSMIPQGGGLQSQLDLALNPAWGNTTENVTKVIVPKGTTIYKGIAAPQNIYDSLGNVIGTLPGGGNQVYIPKVEVGWFQ